MFIVLETWPAASDITPACNEEGYALEFDTYTKAFDYGEENLQNPVVVDINAGRQHAKIEKDIREIIKHAEKLGVTTSGLSHLVAATREAEARKTEKDANRSVESQIRHVFSGYLADGIPVKDCVFVIDFAQWLFNGADPADARAAAPLPTSS